MYGSVIRGSAVNNLFLPALTAEQRLKLQAANIVCDDLTLGTEHGVLLDESQLQRALTALDSKVAAESPAGIDGVKRVLLKSEQELLPVARAAWGQSRLVPIAAQLMMLLGREVVLYKRACAIDPIKDGKFHIHIHSSPTRSLSGVYPPALVWGIPVDCRETAFTPSRRGVLISDEASGYVVAELVGNDNLYIHHKLAQYESNNEEQLFAELLQRVVPHIEVTPERKEKYRRNRFIDECTKSIARIMRTTEVFTGKHSDRSKELLKQFNKTARAARSKEQALLRDMNVSTRVFGDEYEALLNIPKVKDVKVEGKSVIVLTELLHCKDDRTGYIHEIGAFSIELPMGGSSPKWTNLTRRISTPKASQYHLSRDQHAPHVWGDGSACLGNTRDIFSKLLRDRQFAIAAQLAIEFVESANTADDGSGAWVHLWPRVR